MDRAVLANTLAEQSQVGNPNRDREREFTESRRHLITARGERRQKRTLTGKSQAHGNIQINTKGLIQDVRASKKYASVFVQTVL